MGLYSDWQELAQSAQTPEQQQAFWSDYFDAETKNYQKILAKPEHVYQGSLSDLAVQFDMEPVVFTGFLDGINTSLTAEIALEELDETSQVNLAIDYEKLLFNMHKAKADWLYELSEWENVFDMDKRKQIAKDYRASTVFVKDESIGRNDPCPCGSGKKYKKCCGA